MDINCFVHYFHKEFVDAQRYYEQTTLMALREFFFNSKERVVYNTFWNCNDPHSDRLESLLMQLKNYYSLSTADYKIDDRTWEFYLPNVYITIDRVKSILRVEYVSTDRHFHYNDLNLFEYIKQINDKFPLWCAEFEQLCLQNADVIGKLERKWFKLRTKYMTSHCYSDQMGILRGKIDDILISARSSSNVSKRNYENTIGLRGQRHILYFHSFRLTSP